MNSSYSRCLKELRVQRGASSLAFLTAIRGEIGGKVNAKVVNVLPTPVKMSLSFKTHLIQSGPSRKKVNISENLRKFQDVAAESGASLSLCKIQCLRGPSREKEKTRKSIPYSLNLHGIFYTKSSRPKAQSPSNKASVLK
jgi:hypothetical protein